MSVTDGRVDETIDTEVLVVGGGGASLRAALAASQAGARTTVALKGQRGRSGATVSPDSPGAAWQLADECSSGEDSPEVHARNIVEAGLGMASPRLARIMAEEIVERSKELEQWGMEFAHDPAGKKRHYSAYSCFGDQPRAHCVLNSGFGHGGDVVRVLVEQIRQYKVAVHEDVFITDLLVESGRCVGALALGPDGQVVAYRAGAVVLAAGGARQIYPPEAGRTQIDTTGDGYAMALRAGATLTNMEFTQYVLRGVPPFPVKVPGVHWALFPKVLNRHGEDALAPYLPAGVSREQVMWDRTLHFPFSTRDHSKWLDVAVASELRAGRGTEAGTLYLDYSEVDLRTFKPSRLQHIPQGPSMPVVLPEGRLHVKPIAHAINGGILINEQAEATLPGLFTAAEAATGPHGADRLGGGMISMGQVFGERAGRFGAERARQAEARPLSPETLAAPLARLAQFGQGDRDAEEVLSALQEAMGTNLIVLRNEAGLQALIARIEALKSERLPQVAVGEPALLRRAMEVENSLVTADLMARAALMRRESRGSHFREDYPAQDDENWRVNILFHMADGQLRQETGTLE
jgi:fumarate reductase (CoM/CoB) subunit A